jgi:hypothetical protein
MIIYCERGLRSGDHFELATRRGLAKATKDVGWTYDLAYILRGSGFDHAGRILFTGHCVVILSFDIQGVAYPRVRSALPPRQLLVLTRIVDLGRVGYRGLDRFAGCAVFFVGGGECKASEGQNCQEVAEQHGVP